MNNLGSFLFDFGGRQLTATLAGDPPRWITDCPWLEPKVSIEQLLNSHFDPAKLYNGPSDGYYADSVVNLAADFFDGVAVLSQRPSGQPEVVY